MAAESRLKAVGTVGLVLVFMLVMFLLAVLYIHGMVWLSEKAVPWLFVGSLITLAICLLVFLPLSIFRKTRPWAGLGFFFASYLFGTVLFAFSCLVAVQIWGYVALIIGLIFAGIGVVPVAFLAALFHGEWSLLSYVLAGTVLTFGSRYLGIRLAASSAVENEIRVEVEDGV